MINKIRASIQKFNLILDKFFIKYINTRAKSSAFLVALILCEILLIIIMIYISKGFWKNV